MVNFASEDASFSIGLVEIARVAALPVKFISVCQVLP